MEKKLENKMQENLIKIIESKIQNLEDTKLERIEERKREQKIDKTYYQLTKHKEEALEEIRSHGEGSKEASEDLLKINDELKKIQTAELGIVKGVENDINEAKQDLLKVNIVITEKENAQREEEKVDKAINNLLQYKQEALEEIRSHGEGSKEASEDLLKINDELKSKQEIKESKQKIIEDSNKEIEKIEKKYDVKKILEEKLNADWEEAIKENEEFEKKKAEEKLNADWEEAIKENEEFDKRKAEEKLNADWEEAIKENEEFDKRKAEEKLNADWEAAIEENKKFDKLHSQGQKEVLYNIKIGNKAKIFVGNYEFNVGTKEVKKGINLSQEEVSEILDEYIDKEEEKELARELIKNNTMDKTVLNVICKAGIDSKGKKDLINSYLNKCLLPNEEKDIGITYDMESLSKVNILKRIFKREANNNEKSEILVRALKAKKQDIANIDGEYKLNWREKLFGKLGGTLRKAESTDEIEAAYAYNKHVDELSGKKGKEFQNSLHYVVETENLTKSQSKEVKSLAKSQNRQNKDNER